MSANDWQSISAIVGGLAGLGAIAIAIGGLLVRWWRSRAFRGAPKIDVAPTSGSSPDIRLVVTSRDRDGIYRGTAQVVATRNDSNPFRPGRFPLRWTGAGSGAAALRHGETDSLLVARFHLTPLSLAYPMGDVTIVESSGSTETPWDRFAWNIESDERLPEYDLEIAITSTSRKKPLLRRYTLRPAKFSGPLELIERKD